MGGGISETQHINNTWNLSAFMFFCINYQTTGNRNKPVMNQNHSYHWISSKRKKKEKKNNRSSNPSEPYSGVCHLGLGTAALSTNLQEVLVEIKLRGTIHNT
jgi:hypothetical protein